jgi:uncharacterized protein YndB with AHSA1/START domain
MTAVLVRSVNHAIFTIERRLDALPHEVFDAFADPLRHERWYVKADDWPIAEYHHDFRIGGREHGRFSPDGRTVYVSDTLYLDIIADRRIVFAYSMSSGPTPISASVATIELLPDGGGTRLVYTEQGAFLDDRDRPGVRELGWQALLDSLEAELMRAYVDG